MGATRGRVVVTPSKNKPYKIVLEYEGGVDTEQGVETIREGEALIRKRTPKPAVRNTLRDRPSADLETSLL